MFQTETFEDCLPTYTARPSKFGFGFLLGCLTTGVAFAAITVSPYLRDTIDFVGSSQTLDQIAAPIEVQRSLELPSSTVTPQQAESRRAEDSPSLETETPSEESDNPSSQPSSARNAASETSNPESPALSERVMRVMQEVQSRQLENQWQEALNELNALYTEYDQLNSFEQSTLLNFYTNTLLRLRMWEEAISAFTLMTTIPDLRADINARALLSLGQLNEEIGNLQESASYYEQWLDSIDGLDIPEERKLSIEENLENLRLIIGN